MTLVDEKMLRLGREIECALRAAGLDSTDYGPYIAYLIQDLVSAMIQEHREKQ